AHGPVIDAMRALLSQGGTIANRDLRGGTHTAVQGHYRGGNSGSLALYYLWRVGEAMTHHREGFERVYAATESVAPAHLRGEASDADADLFLARKSIAAAGLRRLGPLSPLLDRKVPADEERAIEHALVAAGEIVAVEVEGMRGRNFIMGEDVETVAELEDGLVPEAWRPESGGPGNELSLLSPLDPILDRARLKALFDFDYVWEIYKPAEQVRFGRYVMPILWGDRLVGRVDPKTDRKAGALVVNGLWLEAPELATDPAFVRALGGELARLAEFLGVARIDASAVEQAPLRAAIGQL
ncbi:MAG: crosslink repair DNA glycosylase YcaQ family protein, partial [Dehalococcoidia bacterium]